MILLSAILPAASNGVAAMRRTAIAVSKPVQRLLRALRHRREISRLAEFDEHALKDIGLSRTDVDGALAVSMLSDPSHVLCDIAGTSHGQAARAASLSVRHPMIKVLPSEA